MIIMQITRAGRNYLLFVGFRAVATISIKISPKEHGGIHGPLFMNKQKSNEGTLGEIIRISFVNC